MNASRILVPIVFTEATFYSLRYASRLAMQKSAVLLLLHVAQSSSEVSIAQSKLHCLSQTNKDVLFETRIVIGDPRTTIVEVAESEQVEVIVMAAYGRKSIWRRALGGVSDYVEANTKCPVITVKYLMEELAVQED